jgi:hypothetical protein
MCVGYTKLVHSAHGVVVVLLASYKTSSLDLESPCFFDEFQRVFNHFEIIEKLELPTQCHQ